MDGNEYSFNPVKISQMLANVVLLFVFALDRLAKKLAIAS